MDELRVEDSDGDAFELSKAGADGAVLASFAEMVNVEHTDAVRIVDWLRERFGLTEELTALATGPELVIDVETETGKNRSVRWLGPDVPGELIRLAEIALRGDTRSLTERLKVSVGVERAESDDTQALMLAHIVAIVREVGFHGNPPGPVEAVRALVDEYRAVRREVAGVRPVPAELAVLRELMGTLGAEKISELPVRVQGMMRELDLLAGDIASMAGVTIGPDGANLRALLEKIQEKHRAALANVQAEQERQLSTARMDLRRGLTKQAMQHDDFRRTVPMQIEAALSTERNARAAVQAELDESRKNNRTLLGQLRDRENECGAQRIAMDEVGEALRRAGISGVPNLLTAVQELARARDLNAGAAASFAGKLELAREMLRSVEQSSAPGGAEVLSMIKATLAKTDPEA